ncbi:MAG: glycoside hydrolase family 6 protein [Microlunatus sp.]
MWPGRVILVSVLLAMMTGCSAGAGSPPPPNPLTGLSLWVDPESAAGQAADLLRTQGRAAEADELTPISSQPVATWLVDDAAPATARRVVEAAGVATKVPVLVLYHRPGRDCGSYSAGGAAEQASYLDWVDRIAATIGDRQVIVVLEPDAIPQALTGQCAQEGRPEATYAMLAAAVERLTVQPNALVYLDAGHPGWVSDLDSLAGALRDSGIERAAGFSLNVSNFQTTADNQTYGDQLSSRLDDKQYLVDVSRNGRGVSTADPGSVEAWCNPPEAALGENPHLGPERARAIAFLWIKEPGASDGACRPGEPPAGQYWPEYALQLIRQRPS